MDAPGSSGGRPSPACPLCGGPGRPLYEDMTDLLQDVPGRWTLRLCGSCRLAWPEPRLGQLESRYEGYHTHEPLPPEAGGTVRGLLSSVLRASLGYDRPPPGLLASLLSLVPVLRDHAAGRALWIRSVPGGALLDVGCGNGSFLRRMDELGWACFGIDPDERAGAHAGLAPSIRTMNIPLPEARYPSRSFDVVTMIHVLEHVADPVAMLRECGRISKPRGEILVLTPNLDSRGKARFGRDWRGWECPRHLQVFSRPSLVACARAAGLRPTSCAIPGKAAWWIWTASAGIRDRRLRRGRSPAGRLASGLEGLVEAVLQSSAPWLGAGDEILLRARPS